MLWGNYFSLEDQELLTFVMESEEDAMSAATFLLLWNSLFGFVWNCWMVFAFINISAALDYLDLSLCCQWFLAAGIN